MLQAFIHYSFHFLIPGLLAWTFFRPVWLKAWIVMLLTMAVDVDHLLATPIFDPYRCSINFHLFHTWPFIVIYFLMLFYPKRIVKIIGLGLFWHMITDFMDCFWLLNQCGKCCQNSEISWFCQFL